MKEVAIFSLSTEASILLGLPSSTYQPVVGVIEEVDAADPPAEPEPEALDAAIGPGKAQGEAES